MTQPITLITGARKGIGRFLTEKYCAEGHRVIGCSRTPSDFENANYEHFLLDVADEAAVKAMFSEIRRQHGRVDHVINNAGIAAMNFSLLTPISSVKSIFDTNFTGTFLFCREAGKLMQKIKFGRIVNFTTVAVPFNLEGESVYAASKAAVATLTQVLARELAAFGITCNAVGPGPIKTDLVKAVPEDKLKRLLDRQAIPRFGEYSDVKNVIDFFLKPESGFITGQIVYLGGVS